MEKGGEKFIQDVFKSKSKLKFFGEKRKQKQKDQTKGKLVCAEIRMYYFPVCPCTNT